MSKNVAVFVDVANIFYAAKAAGVDIDYVTLLKAGSAGRDLVRAYAYTGLDPDNENQRNFHDFLRRHGYKVVSKDIRKYGDGKVKANLDIELVVDMMKTARNLDIAIVVSGDGDFAPAIRAVQEMGVRVEVVSFRGNTSSDLIDVADLFTDITQIAKVEKGSSRSGRRVADDDEDLSMTEVPDKQSEGTGEPRRGRGRGRTRTTTEVAATSRSTTATGRTRRAPAAAAAVAGDVPLVVMPGEKLSRVAAIASDLDVDEAIELEGAAADAIAIDEDIVAEDGGSAFETAEDGTRRRRRRRGGRGRGRGRREDGSPEGAADEPVMAADDDDFEPPVAAPRRPSASTFGSVWDSQIGVPAAATGGRLPISQDEEDLDEPPIPEYLIAERRQRDAGGSGRGGSGRGRGGAYAAAMDRERFGGGRGAGVNRFASPPPRRDGGPNRIDRPTFRPENRPDRRPENRPAPRPVSSDEPWSEVPPEIEAMLRAQLGSARPQAGGRGPAPDRAARPVAAAEPETPSRAAEVPVSEAAEAAPKRRATRAPKAAAATNDVAPKKAPTRSAAKPAMAKAATAKPAAAKPTTVRGRKAASGDTAGSAAEVAGEAPAAPKRRSKRTADASA